MYQLLATGGLERVEQWGDVVVRRPEPSALWHMPNDLPPVHAHFSDGKWHAPSALMDGWEVSYGDMNLWVKPTSFRHMGVFPEQLENWEWLRRVAKPGMRALNLFGYTGAATVALAQAGAEVTHVDASKSTVQWASENAARNGVQARWMVDDVLAFLKREVRRGSKYDIVLLDPPIFGRGSKGQIWRLERDITDLLQLVRDVLSDRRVAVLYSGYATTLTPDVFGRLCEEFFEIEGRCIELSVRESFTGKALQSGFSVRTQF